MTSHFLYLIVVSARNKIKQQLRRLRNPRYAIAALVGFAYFFFVFGGYRIGDERPEAGPDLAAMGNSIGPFFLALLGAWWWLWGGHKHGIALLPAERDLLVPAPITRRQLIQYKVMQAQTAIIISALITSVVMRGLDLAWPIRFLSAWVMLATLHQHQIAASLVHAAAEEQGRRGVRRHLVPLFLFSAVLVALVVSLARAVMDIRARPALGYAGERLTALLQEPAVVYALAPFRALLAPTLANDYAAWSQAFVIAALVLIGHYLWLQRTDAAFEEAAAELGAKTADQLSAMRKGGISGMSFTKVNRPKKLAKPWFALEPAGVPAFAIFWKNVVYGQRGMRPLALSVIILVLVAAIGVIGSFDAEEDTPTMIMASVCMGLSAMYSIAGPLATKHDLRTDLRNIDLLRTYPLHGRDLVAAEIAGSSFLITLPQLILTTTGGVLFGIGGHVLPWQSAAIVIGLMLALPVVNTMLVTIQNAIALLFPAWARVGDTQPGGVENMGQGVLTILATLILFLLLLIPPSLVGAVVAGPLYLKLGQYAAGPGILIVIAALAVETWLVILWLGRLYDTTDPVEAGLLR